MDTPKLLSFEEAAAQLGVRPMTVRTWAAAGKLGKVELSRRCVRIPQTEVDRLIRRGLVLASPAERD
jgi:excisionase family DNA binding protein